MEIWLYDGFGSARQLVQQVGRAIRRPDLSDRSGQVAILRGSSKPLDVYEGAPTVAEQLADRWKEYLKYEGYAAERTEIVFTAETQLLATLKRAAPEVQYIAGEFRGGHVLDEEPTMSAFHCRGAPSSPGERCHGAQVGRDFGCIPEFAGGGIHGSDGAGGAL